MTVETRATRSGSTIDYEIEGTSEEIEAEIKSIHGLYPTPGYGTWFHWPPGKTISSGPETGKPLRYKIPQDLSDGRWIARGHRSTSCD